MKTNIIVKVLCKNCGESVLSEDFDKEETVDEIITRINQTMNKLM